MAGVLEAGVPFPPDVQWKRLGRCEALWESSKLGDMPLEEGGVAMPHNEEGLHRGSFPPQEELSSQVEFCRLEVCGLRLEDCVPEKGGKDKGGGSGCRGVEKGVEEELP